MRCRPSATNQKQIIFDNGTDAANNLLYFRLTGVSAFASVSVPVGFRLACGQPFDPAEKMTV